MRSESFYVGNCLNFPRAVAARNSERVNGRFAALIHRTAINRVSRGGMRMRVHMDRSRRSYAKARLCSIVSRRVCDDEKAAEAPAGSCKYSDRPARSNIIIAPSSTRRRLRRDADEYYGEVFLPAFSARSWHVAVVKIFCRDIYGFSPIQCGIKATRGSRTPADTYFRSSILARGM